MRRRVPRSYMRHPRPPRATSRPGTLSPHLSELRPALRADQGGSDEQPCDPSDHVERRQQAVVSRCGGSAHPGVESRAELPLASTPLHEVDAPAPSDDMARSRCLRRAFVALDPGQSWHRLVLCRPSLSDPADSPRALTACGLVRPVPAGRPGRATSVGQTTTPLRPGIRVLPRLSQSRRYGPLAKSQSGTSSAHGRETRICEYDGVCENDGDACIVEIAVLRRQSRCSGSFEDRAPRSNWNRLSRGLLSTTQLEAARVSLLVMP